MPDGFATRAATALPFLTAGILKAAMPHCREPRAWVELLREACARHGINTRLRFAAYLAQIGHESGDLNRLSESLNYNPSRLLSIWPSRFTPALAEALGRTPGKPADEPGIAQVAYGGRMGNAGPGDAYRHRGAGLIQITGYTAHAEVGQVFGLPVAEVPAWLRTKEGAALASAWWWQRRGLNELADTGRIDAISRKVNGGDNGLADRRARYERARRVLDL